MWAFHLRQSYLLLRGVCVHDSGRSVCVESRGEVSLLCRPEEVGDCVERWGEDRSWRKMTFKKSQFLPQLNKIAPMSNKMMEIWNRTKYLWSPDCWCPGRNPQSGSLHSHCGKDTCWQTAAAHCLSWHWFTGTECADQICSALWKIYPFLLRCSRPSPAPVGFECRPTPPRWCLSNVAVTLPPAPALSPVRRWGLKGGK